MSDNSHGKQPPENERPRREGDTSPSQPEHPVARPPEAEDLSRREFFQQAAGGVAAAGGLAVLTEVEAAAAAAQTARPAPAAVPVTLHVNGKKHELKLEPRVTLLD